MTGNPEDKAPMNADERERFVALMGGDLKASQGMGAAYAAATGQFFSDLKEAGVGEVNALELTKEFLRALIFSTRQPPQDNAT